MNPRLRNMLVAVGLVSMGGVTYLLVRPEAGVTRADLADAGIDDECDRVQVVCRTRVAQECRDLPDGGRRPRYGTIRAGAYRCERPTLPDGGGRADVLVTRWPRQGGRDCFEPIGDGACRVVEEGCTDDAVCDESGGPRVAAEPDECACRQVDAGACRVLGPDGGLVMVRVGETVHAPFQGAGCVRKPCVGVLGDEEDLWPEQCPRR